MFQLILLLIIALGIAYFSVQNTVNVPLTITGTTQAQFPLYIVVLGALLLGIVISWIIGLTDSLSSMFTMRRKESALKDAHLSVDRLSQKIHNLEVENASMKGKYEKSVAKHPEPIARDTVFYKPSFFERLKHSFRTNY